jgi:hypothetical protein
VGPTAAACTLTTPQQLLPLLLQLLQVPLLRLLL